MRGQGREEAGITIVDLAKGLAFCICKYLLHEQR